MSSISALFIPCYYDGLPMASGSARIRAEWVCRYWDGAEVYDMTRPLAGWDLYVFQKAYLVETTQHWIRTAARWRDEGKCALAFDLCDPDFLSLEHERRMLDVLPLFDLAVASTEPLKEWLEQWLPAYVIPDRVDVDEMDGIGAYKPSSTDKPRVVWAGYERNVGALDLLAGAAVEDLGLDLTVLSVDRPLPFDGFWRRVVAFDVLLNPRPDVSPHSYKSDNKTLIAWAMGMPVARTPKELEGLLDPERRAEESVKRRAEVLEKWHVRQSVDDWMAVLRDFAGV